MTNARFFTIEFFTKKNIIQITLCNLYKSNMVQCVHCNSDNVRKNGKLYSWWQRRKCMECEKQFSKGWTRDTYSHDFKEEVIDQYCHKHIKAKIILQKYWISSRTLIKWKKEHLVYCKLCNPNL